MKIDLTGEKFHHLTVVQRSEQQCKKDAVLWDCICDCGKKTTAMTYELRGGHKKSCGCLKRVSHAKDITGQRFGMLTVMQMRLRQNENRFFGGPCYGQYQELRLSR